MKIYKIIFLLALGFFAITSTTSAWTINNGINNNSNNGTTAYEPSASPVAGTYTSSKSIVLSATGSSSIHYTTDGTTPSCSSGLVYSTSISISITKTIKAISCYADNGSTSSSNVVSYLYTIRTSSTTSGGGGGGGGSVTTPTALKVIPGCDNRTTGFSSTTGQSCLGNTGSGSPVIGQAIPGCDNRTTGFSYLSGVSCVGNTGTGVTQPTTPTTPTISTIPTTPITPMVTSRGATKFVFTLPLKLGSKGNEVKELQKILIAGGYLVGTADGSFGPKTVAAVKKYQTANGLKADGIVGRAVRVLLNK